MTSTVMFPALPFQLDWLPESESEFEVLVKRLQEEFGLSVEDAQRELNAYLDNPLYRKAAISGAKIVNRF